MPEDDEGPPEESPSSSQVLGVDSLAGNLAEKCLDEGTSEAAIELEIRAYWLNEDGSAEDPRPSKAKPKTRTRMETIWRILVALVFLCPSLYYVWSAGTTKTRSPLPPRPFFSNFSRRYVADFHSGDVTVERLSSHGKITIVMYYAPWDRFSATMRRPFEFVAREFANEPQVRFVAINCFALTGECRRTYRMFSYPVVMAHAGSAVSIYQGEYAADHFFRWVEGLLYPIDYLSSPEAIEEFVDRNLFAIIGYFPQKPYFPTATLKRYLACAFQSNTGQPSREDVRFGVITSKKLAETIDLSNHMPILMQIRDGDPIFFHDEITSDRIEEWLRENAKSDAALHWLTLNKHNELSSTHLDSLLHKSPAIVLFDEQRVLSRSRLLEEFVEVADEYWDCKENTTRSRRKVYESGINGLNCRPAVTTELANQCCKDSWSQSQLEALCSGIEVCSKHQCSEKLTMWSEPPVETCPLIAEASLVSILEVCCNDRLRERQDPRLPDFLKEEQRRRTELMTGRECSRRRTHRNGKYRPLILDEQDNLSNSSVRGFGCRFKNSTLQFGVLDSKHFTHFSKKWGLTTDSPTLLAIDARQELFAVRERANRTSLRKFIIDFHDRVLEDHFLSEEERKSPFSHQVPEEVGLIGEPVLIERLTEKTFRKAVENQIDTVVYFSGGSWHGPSMATLHTFHSISRIFLPAAEGLIKFYIIDVSRNELPYNYNFETYPAVVIFNGKSDDLSWKLPETAPINMPNLFTFILSRCSHQLRLRIAFELLDRVSIPKVLRRLGRHVHWLIARIRSLRESAHQYRKSSDGEHVGPPDLHVHHNEIILKKHVVQLRAARAMISAIQAERLSVIDQDLFKNESLKAASLLSTLKMLPTID